MPPCKSAIVVVVDRLGAGFLGPYGNTWLDTPALNRLAAESTVFETALIDSPDLARTYRAYWNGLHGATTLPCAERDSLAALLANNEIAATLITDEPEVANLDFVSGFRDVLLVPEDKPVAAKTIDQTQLARTFAEAIDRWQSSRPPFLLWLHARGMQGAWDAPYELRCRFANEDDPTTPDFVDPPSMRADHHFDPDELLGVTHGYAGQVVVCDVCLGALLDVVASAPWANETLVVFTSPRGYPLGEHNLVGAPDGARHGALYGELLHVPLLVRIPGSAYAAQRTHALVQPADLFATLCDWFELPSGVDPLMSTSLLAIAQERQAPCRDRLCCVAGDQKSIRTPAWFMRREANQCELFAKPDDRWELNEVSDRCPDVVEELGSKLDEFLQAAQTGDLSSLSPLSDALLHGPE